MSIELLEPRAITGIKVDHTPVGSTGTRPRITITWLDAAGESHEIERHALAAELIITDLHGATLLGEASRQMYLVGFIRCHSLSRWMGPEAVKRGPD